MDKGKWIAVVICLLLTAAAYIGSTGLFYADYRPIRNYDLVAFEAKKINSPFWIKQNKREGDHYDYDAS